MPEIKYVNSTIKNIENQEISIQVSLDGFSFVIFASDTNMCLAFKHYKFNNLQLIDELIRRVEKLISEEPLFSQSYSKATLYYISQKATLIPKEFFHVDQLKKYFEFSHNMEELDELHYNYINSCETYNLFSVPNYLTSIIYPIFPNIVFKHQATQLIEYGFKLNNKNQQTAVIGINSTFFDLAFFEDQQLILSNSFQFSTTTDFIYFFMYACKQLKIDSTTLNLTVLGDAQGHTEIINELKKHTAQAVIPFPQIPHVVKPLTKSGTSKFYNLFFSSFQ